MISDKMKKVLENSSAIREMFEEGKRLEALYGRENVYDFSLGNPSVKPPSEVEKAIVSLVKSEDETFLHGYMNNAGFEDVREEIALSINKRFATNFCFKNIIMTMGASGGLNIILKSILNKDDEVIVFAPYFSEYDHYIENYEGKVVVVRTDVETFEPCCQALEEAITNKTKAVIINTPNNPTGVVYSKKTIEKIADILREKETTHPIYLISDEPYRELVYGKIEVPYVTKYYDNTFVVYSYSKSLSLPGERIGYVVIPDELENSSEMIEAVTVANRILGFVNAPSLLQRVIPACLGLRIDIESYEKNRDLLYHILLDNNFECIKPQGAFYFFIKTPIASDEEFCKIAKKHHLLFVPGSTFHCSGYVRIAYCVPYETISGSRDAFASLAREFDS